MQTYKLAEIPIFIYWYHWVDNGTWQHTSIEDKALASAFVAAIDVAKIDVQQKPVKLTRLKKCIQPDHTNYCYSFKVEYFD